MVVCPGFLAISTTKPLWIPTYPGGGGGYLQSPYLRKTLKGTEQKGTDKKTNIRGNDPNIRGNDPNIRKHNPNIRGNDPNIRKRP